MLLKLLFLDLCVLVFKGSTKMLVFSLAERLTVVSCSQVLTVVSSSQVLSIGLEYTGYDLQVNLEKKNVARCILMPLVSSIDSRKMKLAYTRWK